MGPFAAAMELSQITGIPVPDDSAGLSRWQALLLAASNIIRAYKGQTLSVVTNDSVVMAPSSSYALFLPEAPVTAVTSITIAGVVKDVNDYVFSRGGRLWHEDFTAWTDGATVVYTHGYAEGTYEFALLRQTVLEMCKRVILGSPETQVFGEVQGEAVPGWGPVLLSDTELERLTSLGTVAVG